MTKSAIKKYTERLGFFGMILHYIGRFMTKTEQQVIGKLTVRFGKVKKNRLVFKNREMMDCTDNPEAFYEYLISSGYNKKYEIIWLVSEKRKFRNQNTGNVKFVTAENKYGWSSPLAYYYGATAGFFFYSHNSAGLNRYRCKGQTVVNLWHGCGYKDAEQGKKKQNIKPDFDYALVPGPVFVKTKSPSWLNTDHPKLTVVKHEDYIPKQYLPTFSSHPIELNMHRIRGLSEQFVYFNDDTFIINKMEPEDFFRNGLPRDYCIETALVQDDINNPFACILMNNAALVNMHYSKREVIGRNWKKWFHPAYGKMVFRNMLMLPYREFSSFKYSHISSSFLKSTFEEVWREEGEVLDRVCRTRFRSPGDVNQYVMKYWQYMEGKYEPQSPKIGKFFTIGLHDRQIHDVLRNQKCKILCINDTENIGDFRQQKRNIKDSFESILPEKSAFELSYKDSGGMYDKKCD